VQAAPRGVAGVPWVSGGRGPPPPRPRGRPHTPAGPRTRRPPDYEASEPASSSVMAD